MVDLVFDSEVTDVPDDKEDDEVGDVDVNEAPGGDESVNDSVVKFDNIGHEVDDEED